MLRASPGRICGTPAARAFTLSELLIVIAIIAILAALLFPAAGSAWDSANAARCKTNLTRIWQAQGAWRADNDGMLLNGGSWMGRLYKYVGFDASVFRCAARGEILGYGDRQDPLAEPDNPDYGDPYGSNPAPSGPNSDAPIDNAFELDIYWQEPNGSRNKGRFGWTIPVSGHPWVRSVKSGNRVKYEIDDEGYTGSGTTPTFDDIWFYVYYDEENKPTYMDIIKGSCNSSPYVKYIIEFKINGEVVVNNWVDAIGRIIHFDYNEETPGGGNSVDSQWVQTDTGWERTAVLILGDYALSRGTYEASGGRLVSSVDPRCFFILDFGYHKAVADFVTGGMDPWDKYFIEDPKVWEKSFGAPGRSWKAFQALRHHGQANVLFCDGHIESLGPRELEYSDTRWRNQGY